MTPLYLRCLEHARREGEKDHLRILQKVRFFDTREIKDLIADLAIKLQLSRRRPLTSQRLPFETILIQQEDNQAVLLELHECKMYYRLVVGEHLMPKLLLGETVNDLEDGILELAQYRVERLKTNRSLSQLLDAGELLAWDCVAALACINSPRIVAAEEVKPNFTQSRKLKAAGVKGDVKFTRILLKVHRSQRDGGPPGGETLTGGRALHTCRQHLRILQSGKLTWVVEHERGNAAFGIRIGRYTVKPGDPPPPESRP